MKRFGIQQKLISLFFLLFLPMIAITLWQQVQYYDLMYQNVGEYVMQLVDKINSDISHGIRELDFVLVDLLYSSAVTDFLTEPTDINSLAIADQLTDSRDALRLKTSADCNIVLLSNSSKILASTYQEWTGSNRTLSSQWLDAISRADGGRVIVSGYSVRRENGSILKVVAIARLVRGAGGQQGILLLEIPMEYFYSFCRSVDFGEQGYLMLADERHYTLYSTISRQIGNVSALAVNTSGAGLVEHTDEFVYSTALDSSSVGIQTIAVIPRKKIESRISSMFFDTMVFISVLGIGLIVIVLLAARSFCKPIILIEQAMKLLESGNFSARVSQTRTDELGNLQRGFNHMAEKLGEYVEQEYAVCVREREAQLQALMRMMDPHFMYNTLEAISMTAYLHGDSQTVQMLEHLADMYRFSSELSTRTTLRTALKNLDDYFYLIDIRFDGRLRLHRQVDPSLLDCECLRFTLQPIVENCVVHGFSGTRHQGDIWLTVQRVGADSIEVLVCDNGTGFSEEALQDLRRTLADATIQTENYPHMAIKNIHDRLRLLYGPGNGVAVDHAAQGGAQVRLHFPLVEKTEEESDNSDPD